MFIRLFSIETRKTLKHPALWIGVGALLLLLAAMTFIRLAQIHSQYIGDGGIEDDLLAGLSFFKWIGILVYAVAGAVIAAYDYPDRTIQIWLSRGAPRALLLLARLAAISFFSLALIAVSVAALLGLAVLGRQLIFGAVPLANLDPLQIAPAILRTFVGAAPYLALTLMLAVISRSPLVSAGGAIVYASVLEPLANYLHNDIPFIVDHLPARLAAIVAANNVLLDKTEAAPSITPGVMTAPQAALAILILVVVMTLISLLVFSRQDLGG